MLLAIDQTLSILVSLFFELFILFTKFYVYEYFECMYGCVLLESLVSEEASNGCHNSWNWSYTWFWHAMWMLGTEPGYCEKTANVMNHCAVSSAPGWSYFKTYKSMSVCIFKLCSLTFVYKTACWYFIWGSMNSTDSWQAFTSIFIFNWLQYDTIQMVKLFPLAIFNLNMVSQQMSTYLQ